MWIISRRDNMLVLLCWHIYDFIIGRAGMIYGLGTQAQRVVDTLKRRILSGEFKIGSKLPPHTQLAIDFVATPIARDPNGEVAAPDAPGLGVAIDLDGIKRYLVETEITVGGRTLYRTPSVD